MKIVALCDKDTGIGLRLAGITDVRVPNEKTNDTIVSLWNEFEDDYTDIGLLFITENIAETLGKRLTDFRIRNLIPIIIEIPDKKGRKPDHVDYVTYLIKKAVGMEIKK